MSNADKQVICLDIPDTYGYMSLAWIEVLKTRLRDYVAVPE